MTRAWLGDFDWEVVTATNSALCKGGHALHKPTSDGHEPARALWDETHRRSQTLEEAVELCRRCHRLAPFCNFNGNTFASIARNLVPQLGLSADKAYLVRSWIGHMVAGVATPEESRAFESFARGLAA